METKLPALKVESPLLGKLPAYPMAEKLAKRIRFLIGGSQITDDSNKYVRWAEMGRQRQYGAWFHFTSRAGVKVSVLTVIGHDCGGRWGGKMSLPYYNRMVVYGDVEINGNPWLENGDTGTAMPYLRDIAKLSPEQLVEFSFILEVISDKKAGEWHAEIKEVLFQEDVRQWQLEHPERTY